MGKAEFRSFVEDKRAWYKKVGTVFCPALNEAIVFNAKGFYHLRYNGTGKMRTEKEQYYRLNLLKFSVQVINQAKEIKELQERASGKYWKLSSVVDNQTIVVILRKSGLGPIIFYSLWRD